MDISAAGCFLTIKEIYSRFLCEITVLTFSGAYLNCDMVRSQIPHKADVLSYVGVFWQTHL